MDDSSDRVVGRMVIKNRFTGEVVSQGAPIYPNDIPFHVPAPGVVIWRYLDWFKFEDLVVNRHLYFRRSDHLDDQMEGRFSEANRNFQTALWKRFNEAYAIKGDAEQAWQTNEITRRFVFLNCWHMNQHESARMWKLYTRSRDSVVIRSQCGLLDSSTDGRTYRPVLVRYVGEEEPRPEFHSLAPFVFKDTSFRFESEVRLIVAADFNDPHLKIDTELHRMIPVRPEELILDVRTHPAATKKFRHQVAKLCSSYIAGLRSRPSVLSNSSVA